MNLFPQKSLEYTIIEHLQKQSWVIVDLIEDMRKTRPKLAKQGVYQAIRKLKKLEIVVITKKRVALSSVWIDRMHEFFTVAKRIYEGAPGDTSVYRESFVALEDGDQITYVFKNPKTTDVFWGHAFNVLQSIMPKDEPLYMYSSHEWSFLAREETETELMRKGEEEGHPWYAYISHKDPLDIFTKKKYFGRTSMAHVEDKFYFKENFYFNTYGDYIIEVTLDPKTQKSIDDFYKSYSVWDDHAKARLNFIVSHMKGRNKLTISRNAKKAEKYKKLFRKYFPVK
jgi:hypothetical protein